MKITVRGPLRDTLAFILSLRKRKRIFRKAAIVPLNPGPMNVLAGKLHPRRQRLVIESVKDETPSIRTYRLVPAGKGEKVAFFKAGEYIAVEETVDGTPVSRPFSISSTPGEAAEGNYYDITIKTGEDGFFAPWSAREWKPGRILTCSEPSGTFTYEPLRDSAQLVCLAGGCGITPFRSIIGDTLLRREDVRITLLYGITDPSEIAFEDELEALQESYPDRFSMTVVCSEPERGRISGRGGETGFITEELILREVLEADRASFFVCGPPAMYEALMEELEGFRLPPKRLRREHYGRPVVDAGSASDGGHAPGTDAGKKFSIRIAGPNSRGQHPTALPAAAAETVLIALERAGLNPPAICRSGECGWCRSRLVSGEVYTPPENDGRRAADRKFGWFHPCVSYPRSDLVIEVPANPISNR